MAGWLRTWGARRARAVADHLEQRNRLDPDAPPPFPTERPPMAAGATTEVDSVDYTGWAARVEADPVRAADLAAAHRARVAQAEAERDLHRLRARHWSGQRLVDEAGIAAEWWEHADADPYAVLGLLPGASLAQAASARRRIAHLCHPDRVSETEQEPEVALRRMVAANAAYDRIRRALHPV